MKTHLLLLAAAGALALPLFFTAATRAGDLAEPRSDADAGAEPPTDAEPLDGGADADAASDAAPPLPSYRAEPFPEARSPEPRAKKWAAAPKVALDRSRAGLPCEARRLREWIRLRCTLSTGAVSLLGGNLDGLALRLDPAAKEDFPTLPEAGEIVLPVRRGDRRAVEWLEAAFGYKGSRSVEPSFVLSEQWPPGDEQPTVVAE